jgi:hypothetical protein
MMSGEAIYEELLSAAAFEGDRAGLRIVATYEPTGGPGSRVFPPTYPQPRPDAVKYLIESRRVDGVERDDVVLDGTASQANRAEEALLRARRSGETEIPLLELRHEGEAPLVLPTLNASRRRPSTESGRSDVVGGHVRCLVRCTDRRPGHGESKVGCRRVTNIRPRRVSLLKPCILHKLTSHPPVRTTVSAPEPIL